MIHSGVSKYSQDGCDLRAATLHSCVELRLGYDAVPHVDDVFDVLVEVLDAVGANALPERRVSLQFAGLR